MQYLKLDENTSSDSRIAFRIIKPTAYLFGEWFYRMLESRSDLQAFRPELSGPFLFIDATNHAGVADAFDTIVGHAHGSVEHARTVEAEKQQIDDQAKQSAIERFKKSQTL